MKLCLSLKWQRTPLPFLDTEIQLNLKVHVMIELDKVKRFIHPSVFCGLFFKVTFFKNRELNECISEGSLSKAIMTTRTSAEHVISPFCNHFWVSRIFPLACWVFIFYSGVKFHTQFLNRLEKKRKTELNIVIAAKDRCSLFFPLIVSASWLH